MKKLGSYRLAVVGVAALVFTLGLAGLGPKVAQAGPDKEPVPFQQSFSCGIQNIGDPVQHCVSESYTVPAGKQLVVEYVSGVAVSTENMAATLWLGEVTHRLALGNLGQWYQWTNARTVSQPMLGFANAGAVVKIEFSLDKALSGPVIQSAVIECVVSGHLVPAPAH